MKQISALLSLVVLAFANEAVAQNTVIVVQPDPLVSLLGNAGKQDFARLGQSMGAMLNSAMRGKQATKVVVVIQCDRIVSAAAAYSDGTNKVVTVDLPVDRADIAATQAVMPILQVIELGCNK